ncbi:class I SAM-dependent methyltransferase [Patescibacteria group bacterium]|nr:class I SAM-dependent methyltransferase [Patescibacteria group bacterium]
MPRENTLKNCRLCKSPLIRFVLKRDGLCIFRCIDCGVVFLGNDLDDREIKDLYKYYGYSAFSNYLSPITKIRYEKLLDSFEKYRKNNTIIDVGCGAGYFMLSASNRGWQADGTEISEEAIKLAEEKGQKVLKGDISDLDLKEKTYDVAVLMELLEHSSNPEQIIKKLSCILRPGGLVYITTPNYNSLARRIAGGNWGMFSKEHSFYFTAKGLKRILHKYGFKIKSLRTENISLIEISKIFKKRGSFNFTESYEKQEHLRELTEKRRIFSAMKRLANFILNIFKIGDSVCILAEKMST